MKLIRSLKPQAFYIEAVRMFICFLVVVFFISIFALYSLFVSFVFVLLEYGNAIQTTTDQKHLQTYFG